MPKSITRRGAALAVLGTGSEVGKSIVTTALCRIFARRGMRVAPFKAQNMSNNSGVTPEGLEMGRAQIVQAEAAQLPAHVDMNPILLKPTAEAGSQVVLFGKTVGDRTASEDHPDREPLFLEVCAAFDRLSKAHDIIVIEGAGSCAEVNLMPRDIVNLRMAEHAQAPVILVADIHRGGVFAQIIGTLECLSDAHRKQIAGFIINRFRGDLSLFEEGVRWIETRTAKKIFGVVPWLDSIRIEAEDSVVLENSKTIALPGEKPGAIGVIRLPHISNFTDFESLASVPDLDLCFLEKVQRLSGFKAVILPGSKNTRFDLNWLHTTGWSEMISDYADSGGHVLGICGGYQMMGHFVHDPHGLEGFPGTTKGLMLLPLETTLEAPKVTTRSCFSWQNIQGTGYEIHMGNSRRFGGQPLFQVHERNHIACRAEDGCQVSDFRIMGTYMHGLFDIPEIARHWLKSINLGSVELPDPYGHTAKNAAYDQLAAHFEKHVNMDAVFDLISLGS